MDCYNIDDLRKRLWSESNPDTRWHLQSLLVAEEGKLAADLELLANVDRHIADGYQRIERQRRLVSAMECDGRNGLSTACALLDRIVESQLLHEWYRKRILTRIKQKRI